MKGRNRSSRSEATRGSQGVAYGIRQQSKGIPEGVAQEILSLVVPVPVKITFGEMRASGVREKRASCYHAAGLEKGRVMFGWFKSKSRERRKKVRSDRKHLEERTRRFLKSYLEADEMRKPQFYRAVEDISKKCQPTAGLTQSDQDDVRIAEAASQAAMQMVLDRIGRLEKEDRVGNFVTDACATVAVAYHRAAGAYLGDEDMEKLGTAAVHLLTMATSYMNAQE